MSDTIEMTFCGQAHKDPNWKREPGYFGYVNWLVNGNLSVKPKHNGFATMMVVSPTKELLLLPIVPVPKHLNKGVSWRVEGTRQRPTLVPSVNSKLKGHPKPWIGTGRKWGEGWHGYIKDGVLTNAFEEDKANED